MDIIQAIEDLSNAFGPSGFEEDVLVVAKRHLDSEYSTQRDTLLNLYANLAPSPQDKPVVMLDAHTDEVGFMVNSVMPNGQITFSPIGGWVPNTVPAHTLVIRTAAGRYIPGVVASKPPHFQNDREQKGPLELSSLTLDVGASNAREVQEIYGIETGDPVVPDTRFRQLDNGILYGKAFDCRIGCVCAIETMNRIKAGDLAVHPVLALASQEEVGIRGATVTANTVSPDVAIVFEGTPADDPFAPAWQTGTALKKGPMLRHMDAGMITNPRLLRWALDRAKQAGIPVQHAVRTGGSTNGSAINLSRAGVPALVIGIPVRYIHSHYGLSALSDVQDAVRLAVALLENLDRTVIKCL